MEKAEIEIAKALKAAGIKFRVGGCGCCRSPWISGTLANGEDFSIDDSTLNTDDLPDTPETQEPRP